MSSWKGGNAREPPRLCKPPPLPSVPNQLEGELEIKWKMMVQGHEHLERIHRKMETFVEAKHVSSDVVILYVSSREWVEIKSDWLPEMVAYAEASGLSVSSSLLAEARVWTTYKALLGAGPLAILASVTDSPVGFSALAALTLGGAPLVSAPAVVLESAAFLAALEAGIATLSSELAMMAGSEMAVLAATEIALGVTVAEAGTLTILSAGLWLITLPLRLLHWCWKASQYVTNKEQEKKEKQGRRQDLEQFKRDVEQYIADTQKYLEDYDRWLNLLKAWDLAQRSRISCEVTEHYYD